MARLLDSLFVLALALVGLLLYGAVVQGIVNVQDSLGQSAQQVWNIALGTASVAALIGIGVVFPCLYYWLPVARTGQTWGKRIMRIKVVHVETGGAPGKGKAAGRLFAGLGLSFIPFGSLLNVLWPLWDQPHRQALHDKAAGTRVAAIEREPLRDEENFADETAAV